jgi:hypothetical protein
MAARLSRPLAIAVAILVAMLSATSTFAQSGDSDPGPVGPAAEAARPPDGVWRAEVSAKELAAAGGGPIYVGIATLTLDGGNAAWSLETPTGDIWRCTATYAVVEAVVRFFWAGGPDCDGVVEDLTWFVDEAGLQLTLVAAENAPSFADNAAAWSAKPWTKVGDAPTASAPATPAAASHPVAEQSPA